MYGREKHVLLRHYLEQGMSKAAIARELGVDRRTIYRWVGVGDVDRGPGEELVRYGPRVPKPTKRDPYKGIIRARLEAYTELSAIRLLDEIRATGYRGGYTQLKEYVRQVRPRSPADPVVRFETPPGHQGQVDFADFRLPWGKRYAFLVVLGFSRILWLQFFSRQTMQEVFEGLEGAFEFFGGVPRELLFDQMKAVIIRDERDEGGRVTENAEFVRFANHHDFRIRACRPYRARTKGKVERPVRYVRSSFFYGRTFTSDSDLNHQAHHWLDHVANVRIHGTLEEAKAADRLGHRLKTLTHPALLVVDEIGYLPVNQTGAMLFFQLINRRYERASTVLTSNKGFEEWGDVLGDEVMAAALIDRLLHHCHIVNIRGNSYRMRHHTELSKVLHSPPAESSSSPPRKRRRTSKETTTT